MASEDPQKKKDRDGKPVARTSRDAPDSRHGESGGAAEAQRDDEDDSFRYGILEARPQPEDVSDSAGPHFHYLLEFCHTHPGSHEKKAPNWRNEQVLELGGHDPRHRPLPGDFEVFLDTRTRFGIKVGLENVRALLARLHLDRGLPPVIIVGGTNGKGTVAHAIGEALSVAGYRPGVYTSPHVEHYLERIQVSNADPDEEALEGACSAVRRAVEALDEEGTHPTYFEVGTALALDVFRRHRATPLVLEVGMGGRWDAVNALEPTACIITNVGSDHAEYLGNTLEERVREKAGILRRGVPCFTSAQGEALRLLEQEAIKVGAPLIPVLPAEPAVLPEEASLSLVRAVIGDPRIVTRLPRLRDLDQTTVRLPRLPGRQERFFLGEGRSVLLDVAHNAEALAVLAERLDMEPGGPEGRVLLAGLLRDKPVEALADVARRCRSVHLTRPLGDRARSAEELRHGLEALGVRVAHAEDDPQKALGTALEDLPEDGLLVVAGSFYLAAAVRPLLRRATRRG